MDKNADDIGKSGPYWGGGTSQMAKEKWAILGRWHFPDGISKNGL